MGVFRWVFGLVMFFQFWIWLNEVPDFVANIHIRFTYDFFHWIKPLSPQGMSILLCVLMGFSLLLAVGVLYRISALAVFLGAFYVFHIEQTLYNNHYYLEILIAFLMLIVDGNAFAAIGSQKNSYVPRWQLLIFQLQFFVVYFYGGIAKLNTEWLIHAQPVLTWLPDMMPGIYEKASEDTRLVIAYFISYSGLIFDLGIGFLLMGRKTYKLALVLLFLFHGSNALMFSIGVFPYFAFASSVLFVPSSVVLKWFNKIKTMWGRQTETLESIPKLLGISTSKKRFIVIFFSLWMAFQFLFPLRHWIIPGWVFWDERGYKFSWFMKLRSKTPLASIRIRVQGDPQDYYVEPEFFITKKQAQNAVYKPLDMVQFAHKLEKYIHDSIGEKRDVKVYAELYSQLHDHPMQMIIDPNQDLTAIDYENNFYIGSYSWIIPFDPNAKPLDLEFLEQFKDKGKPGVYR